MREGARTNCFATSLRPMPGHLHCGLRHRITLGTVRQGLACLRTCQRVWKLYIRVRFFISSTLALLAHFTHFLTAIYGNPVYKEGCLPRSSPGRIAPLWHSPTSRKHLTRQAGVFSINPDAVPIPSSPCEPQGTLREAIIFQLRIRISNFSPSS